MMIPYRIRQVTHYLNADRKAVPALPADAALLLNEPMLHQFRLLTPADQSHLISVFSYLKESGAQKDTVTAGLIHDVGKACMKCNITVADRAAHVLLNRAAPGLYRRFASRESVPSRFLGLHRLANHAERGALAASQAGYNERICWLIRHHETGGDPTDRDLNLLREADHAASPGVRP